MDVDGGQCARGADAQCAGATDAQYTWAPTGARDAADGRRPRRVRVVRGGPMLVEGPVEVTTDDGSVVRSDRFMVALCLCHRSGDYPLCDTSHRRRERARGGARRPSGSDG